MFTERSCNLLETTYTFSSNFLLTLSFSATHTFLEYGWFIDEISFKQVILQVQHNLTKVGPSQLLTLNASQIHHKHTFMKLKNLKPSQILSQCRI